MLTRPAVSDSKLLSTWACNVPTCLGLQICHVAKKNVKAILNFFYLIVFKIKRFNCLFVWDVNIGDLNKNIYLPIFGFNTLFHWCSILFLAQDLQDLMTLGIYHMKRFAVLVETILAQWGAENQIP